MPRKLQAALFALAISLLVSLPNAAAASQDPVARFIAFADSLLQAGDDGAFTSFVEANAVLAAAAVGQLLEAAIETGDRGERSGEREHIAFAEMLAESYRKTTGSQAPLALVAVYRRWTPEQRSIRKHAKEVEKQASSVQKAGDLDKAVALYHEARSLYEKIGDKRSIAVIWGSLGVAHWSRNDMNAVKESYEKALAARREIEDRILEGKTLNGLGSLHFMMGEYETAVSYYQGAIELRRKTGDMPGLGVSLTYVGNANARLGRLGEAGDAYREALGILETDGSPAQLVDALNGIANVYSEMGRFAISVDAYRRAIRICADSGEPSKEAPCRLNLAGNLKEEGRYREAIGVLDTLRLLLDANPNQIFTTEYHRNLGLTYLAMGELNRARENLLASLKESDGLDDPFYAIEALVNLGCLYRDLGAFEDGLSCAEKAGVRAREAQNFRMLREAVALAGDLEVRLGRYGQALERWQWALERDHADGFAAKELEDQLNLANILAHLGRMEEARQEFRSSRSLVLASGRSDLAWGVEFGIAHTYDHENPDSAYVHYEKAFTLLERSRATIGGAELQTGFLSGERRRLFEDVARYYASLDGDAKDGVWSARAFSTIEKGKARGLLDLLERSVGTQDSPGESALLDSLYHMDRETPAYAEKENLLRNRYIEVRNERLGKSLGALGFGGGTVSVPEVREALGKGTTLLEYALGDTTSLLWVVDRDGHEIYALPNRAALGLEVERLRDALASPGAGDEVLLKTARSLYEQLIGPAEKRISKARRLVIIPDGILFEAPFDILLTEEPKAGEALKKQPFLMRKWSTVYCPSASVYRALREQPTGRSHDLELAALGAPDFSRIAGDGFAKLPPLPNSLSEVQGISARLDNTRKAVLTGAEANEAALKALIRGHEPRIIHLATHGLIDAIEPMRSSVVLSPCDNPKEDGPLYMLEILSLPVRADLVVLSACESGAGSISRGEGVVGLSRAFIAAGARGVVASLWAVSDVSTAELMERFYDVLFSGKTPACEALRKARASLLDDPKFSHPFYWSPFIVIGTERTPW